MIRKTFTTKPEAETYADMIREEEGVAVVGSLGDKFRVYGSTKDDIESQKKWGFRHSPEYYLREAALKAKEDVGNALALKKSMDSGEIYNDYETALEAARIMADYKELRFASDVFDFIDHTNKYDDKMKQYIDETLTDYDYEAKEEVAKE